jgi:Thiol:disulfide interchange protein DsbD, N-terminal
MRRFVLAALLTVAVGLATTAFAQSGPPTVSLVSASPVVATPGHISHVTLTFRVGEGFHINSHKPLDELLLPTVVQLDPPTDIMIAKIEYPAGEMLSFPFSPESKLSVYSGEFKVTAAVRPAAAMPHGTFRVHGDLRFQACNNRQCFPPKKIPVEFDVKVQRSTRGRKG